MNGIKNIQNVLKDVTKEALDDFIKKAEEKQKNNDIITFVMALSEAGLKVDDLYNFLNKFWGITDILEAKEFIEKGRYQEWPRKKLMDYLLKIGFSRYEIVCYMKEHDVLNKFKTNLKLCELSDEKLKMAVEKK